MDVKLKMSKNDENGYTTWGFVELYKVWKYGSKGYIEVVLGFNPKTEELAEPYVFRKEEFIKASQIEDEMGISKYIKAKKPFYSLLVGNLVLKMHVGYDFEAKEKIEEKSYNLLYKPIGFSKDGKRLNLIRQGNLSKDVLSAIEEKVQEVIASDGDREIFIKGRFKD